MNYLKAIVLNIGVLVSTFIVAWAVKLVDPYFGVESFTSPISTIIGILVIVIGLVFRLWASYTFYSHGLAVLALKPQHRITQSGPYKYTRNPLYIGIVFILLGWALAFGTKLGLLAPVIAIIIFHLDLVLKGERELENKFGEEYRQYKLKVGRWF